MPSNIRETFIDLESQKSLIAFQYLPNGKVMFAADQTTLEMRLPLNSGATVRNT